MQNNSKEQDTWETKVEDPGGTNPSDQVDVAVVEEHLEVSKNEWITQEEDTGGTGKDEAKILEVGSLRQIGDVNMKVPEDDDQPSGITTTTPPGQQEQWQGTSMTIPCKLFGREISAVIDSAAQISVISQEFFDTISPRPKLEGAIKLKGAGKKELMTGSMCKDQLLTIGKSEFKIDLCVAPITDDLLLGIDFLAPNKSIIDFAEETVTVKETITPAEIKRNPSGAIFMKRVETTRNTIVPPNSVKYFQARIIKPVHKNTCVVFQPENDIEGLQFPAVLVKNKAEFPLHVINLTDKYITVPRATSIGTVMEAVEVLDEDLDDSDVPAIRKVEVSSPEQAEAELDRLKEEMPNHLQDLFKRSISEITNEQAVQLGNLLIDFQDIFAKHDLDIGCFEGLEHTIDTGDNPPVRQRLRRTPLGYEGEEEKHLDKLLKQGIITPSSSAWASPPVLVRKKDGSVRYCIDYRILNSCTVKDSFPIPSVDMCLDTLAGSKYFSTLDLASGYYNLKVKASDRHKTAFCTKFGVFEHIRLPFGLCNSPATFMRGMELILRGLTWKTVLAYLDDVIVLGSTFEEHLKNLHEVFIRFRLHNVKLKPSKCNLCGSEVEFLGKHVCSEGVKISPKKLSVVRDWPTPKNQKQLESFIGYASYHREFIDHFEDVIQSLRLLNTESKKLGKFSWTDIEQQTFNQLKDLLSSSPCLAYPLAQGKFILDTDASDYAIGAELSQVQDGKERTVAFASNVMTSEQRRYCTTRKELLAVIRFTRHFRHYLLGRSFFLRTDHSSLSWLMRFKDPIGQLARWLEELQQYDMTIIHRPGKLHTNADALSRMPDDMEVCNCYHAGEKVEDLPCGGCPYCTRAHTQWARFSEDVDDVVPLAVRELTNVDLQQASTSDQVDDLTSSSKPTSGEDHDPDPPPEPPNWAFQYSKEDLRSYQLKDPDVGLIIQWLEGTPPEAPGVYLSSPDTKALWLAKRQLRMEDGILFYDWEQPPITRKLFVVPESLKKEVIGWCHDSRTAGHLGRDKTLWRARQSCFWRGMKREIEEYIQSCSTCNRNKNCPRRKTALRKYHAGYPMERVHIDILGPFTPSDNNNVYILSMIDQFSKWIECAPLPEQTAQQVAEKFVDKFITTFGCPLHLHSDQGKQFESKLFQELCRILEIAKTRTTPYHPSSNGQVERYNQVILHMVRCFVGENVTTWDEELPLLTMALHSTVHRQTGYTPNRLMLGREVMLPLDILLGTVEDKAYEPAEWVKELETRLAKVHKFARDSLKTAQARQKKDYDINLRNSSYEPGDVVYRLDETSKVGLSRKLQAPWSGPFLVTNSRPPIYQIQTPRREFYVHHDKLKIGRDRLLPLWLRRARHKLFYPEANKQNQGTPQSNQVEDPTASQRVNSHLDSSTNVPEAGGTQELSGVDISIQDDSDPPTRLLEDDLPFDFLDGSELQDLFRSPRVSSRGRRIRDPVWMSDYVPS